MTRIGPFLARTQNQDTFFWLQIILAGYEDREVWAIEKAPFIETETGFPNEAAFTQQTVAPTLFYVFDPAHQNYFSLAITSEHALYRLIPKQVPQDFTFGNIRVYRGAISETIHPTPLIDQAEIRAQRCQTFYNALHQEQLLDIAKTQYAQTRIRTAWEGFNENIPAYHLIAEEAEMSAVTSWSYDGFAFVWQALKEASTTPFIYCSALTAILYHGEKAAEAKEKCSIANISEEMETLNNYLLRVTDKREYGLRQKALVEELIAISSQLSTPLSIQANEIRSFEIMTNESSHIQAAEAHQKERAHFITDTLEKFHAHEVIWFQQSEIRAFINDLKSCLMQCPSYTVIRRELEIWHEDRAFAYELELLGENLTEALDNLLSRLIITLQNLFYTQLQQNIRQTIQNNPTDNEAFVNALFDASNPILQTSYDMQVALHETGLTNKVRPLLDAMHVENKAVPSSFIQTMQDLNRIVSALTLEDKQYLFKKRRPLSKWGHLLQSKDDFIIFRIIFTTNERNRIIKGHAARIAGWLKSTEDLVSLFDHFGLNQLKAVMPHVPLQIKTHWIQTPERFSAFFRKASTGAIALNKATYILKQLPTHTLIAVFKNAKSPEQQSLLIHSISFNLIKIYWARLSNADWLSLFPNLTHLKAVVQSLDSNYAFGNLYTMGLIKNLSPDIITHYFSELIAPATTYNLRPKRTRLNAFSDLKTAVIALFSTQNYQPTFYTNHHHDGNIHKEALEKTETVLALKGALIKIYCQTNIPRMLKKITDAKQLIDTYETNLNASLEHATELEVEKSGSTSKRHRLR